MRAAGYKLGLAGLMLMLAALAPVASAAEVNAPQPQRRAGPTTYPGVFKGAINANWFANNTRFWYRNDLRNQEKEFVLVDAEAGTRAAAFDHKKLGASLATAAAIAVNPAVLPFDAVQFSADLKSVSFAVNGKGWRCDLTTYEVTRDEAGDWKPATIDAGEGGAVVAMQNGADDIRPAAPQAGRGRGAGGIVRAPPQMPVPQPVQSPDRQSTALVRNHNVFLRTADGKETQLSQDGQPAFAYTQLFWSPDSATLVAYRQELGAHLPVYRVQSSPPVPPGGSPGGVGRAILVEQTYDLPGDKLDSYEMNLFTISGGKQVKPEIGRIDMREDGQSPYAGDLMPHWMEDGVRFLIEKVDRGHQRLRVFNINAKTGETKAIIDEQSKTFIWTANRDGQNFPVVNMLKLRPGNQQDATVSNEIIYASEKSGYRHLYLVNATTGESKQIDRGDWPLRNVERVDQQARRIWFAASGIYPDQDPYLIHYGHVNFDGTEQVIMTAGNGNHADANDRAMLVYSPDRKYIIDSYNRVDMAPVSELRRVSDGKLMVELEKADVQAAWSPPEVFVAKGRDGKTDIWGIIVRPANFDATKKYPIIEDIYAGPHDSFVPKNFSPGASYRSLTSLGFIVVKIDGMGTANRSKAFHDVCWQNLADAGFPDRIRWIKAAAAKYPYMDIDRVGIYGTSAGGQSAAGAVLFHPEFYKVAVANCGCHDNRMDKATWNEQWMGYPVGPHYAACSNIDNAGRLQGRLQLVVGELDSNVPPESTYRFVDALNRANKDYEFVLVPGGGHGAGVQGETIVQTKMQDFFVRYLLNQNPPERNKPRP